MAPRPGLPLKPPGQHGAKQEQDLTKSPCLALPSPALPFHQLCAQRYLSPPPPIAPITAGAQILTPMPQHQVGACTRELLAPPNQPHSENQGAKQPTNAIILKSLFLKNVLASLQLHFHRCHTKHRRRNIALFNTMHGQNTYTKIHGKKA